MYKNQDCLTIVHRTNEKLVFAILHALGECLFVVMKREIYALKKLVFKLVFVFCIHDNKLFVINLLRNVKFM